MADRIALVIQETRCAKTGLHLVGLEETIDALAFYGYRSEFVRCFPHLRCERTDKGVIRFWRHDAGPTTLEDYQRVELWHAGYYSALRQWRPADYLPR
jgi:hypothetical protein